jgi:hypothetical protein
MAQAHFPSSAVGQAQRPNRFLLILMAHLGKSMAGKPMAAFHPLRTLDGPRLRLTVEQPSSGIPGDAPPYRPQPVTEMIPAAPIAERLVQLPTRLDVWRAALVGTLTGAAIVIAWIELVHRVCL